MLQYKIVKIENGRIMLEDWLKEIDAGPSDRLWLSMVKARSRHKAEVRVRKAIPGQKKQMREEVAVVDPNGSICVPKIIGRAKIAMKVTLGKVEIDAIRISAEYDDKTGEKILALY